MKTRQHRFELFILMICCSISAAAQINIDSDDFTYDQLFENLVTSSSTWTNNSTIPNWYATSENGALTTYESANNATSGIHSYGTANNERAMGTIAANATGNILFGAHFKNNSGETINSIVLSFRAEHWRSPNSNVIGHQRTKVSYAIANSIAVTDAALLANNSFVDIPEAYLVTLDTTGNFAALDGNSRHAVISVTFPVTIPDEWEFFLRFKDEDIVNEFDAGLAVDDLHITFQTDIVPRIVGRSGLNDADGYTVFEYIDMGIVADVPPNNSSPPYIDPTNDMDEWQVILDSFYDDNDLDDVDASAYGYVAVEFFDLYGRSYQVLRKQSTSPYYWGTYVKTIFSSSKILIQAPHVPNDIETGTQSAAVYYISEANGLMLSGISRCASNITSGCDGQTSECVGNNNFRISDLPHATVSIFHLATTILATINSDLVFVQLHGSEQDDSDPEFVISCGTLNGQFKSVPDYAVILRENLLLDDPDLYIKVSHVDSYSPLAAQTNVQGRYLNQFPANICDTDNTLNPQEVTNRFLHIEQFTKHREWPPLVANLANAIKLTIPQTGYERSLLITSDPEYFPAEYFSNLDYFLEPSNTWGNNLRVLGWYAVHEETTDNENIPDGLFGRYGLDNSPGSGGLYAFGNPADYALGSFSTPSVTNDIAYGVLFKNVTGVTLNQMSLQYNAEQWRVVSGQLDRVTLSYTIANQIDLSPAGLLYGSFTNVPAGDMIASDDGSTSWQDGNLNITPITVAEIPIVLNPDEEIFIRFFDNDDSDSDEVMALDDFEISFSSDPPPMPVDWLYFNITNKNGSAVLQWGADKEADCKNYEILRSDNGKDFESIASLNCKGKSHNNQYEFVDYSPAWQPNIYYKIAQHDENGEVNYSPLRAYNSNALPKPEVYFKNGELIIEALRDAKLLSASVFDFMGRQFCRGTPVAESNSRYSLNCPNASNQLVVVQLIFDSGSFVTHLKTGN